LKTTKGHKAENVEPFVKGTDKKFDEKKGGIGSNEKEKQMGRVKKENSTSFEGGKGWGVFTKKHFSELR